MNWHDIRISLYIIFFVLVSTSSLETTQTSQTSQTSDKQNSDSETEQMLITSENENAEVTLPEELENNYTNYNRITTITTIGNLTISAASLSNTTHKIYSNCLTNEVYGTVEVVNATRLMELLTPVTTTNHSETNNESKVQARTCLLVLFYARWCIFSSQAAPHFNALPRFFPRLKAVAIDASRYQNFNTQFGIVGVPSLMFIYNGKPLVKFNDTSYTLESFARFVTTYTGLEPNGSLYVTSTDFGGPLQSTLSNETDDCLLISWIFIAACAIYFIFQSRWWQQFVELVQNTWRESNAQHEHVD